MFGQVSCSFWPTHPMLEQCSAISSSEFENLAYITKMVSQTEGIAPRAPTITRHSGFEERLGKKCRYAKRRGTLLGKWGGTYWDTWSDRGLFEP